MLRFFSLVCVLVFMSVSASQAAGQKQSVVPASLFDIDVKSEKAFSMLLQNRNYTVIVGFLNLKTCKPCQTANVFMPKIRRRLQKKDIVFVHLDVRKFPKIVEKYKITRTPSYLVLVGEKPLGKPFNPVQRDGTVNVKNVINHVTKLHGLAKKYRKLDALQAHKAYELMSANVKLKDDAAILKTMTQAANYNHPLSQFLLAQVYKGGVYGTKKDLGKCMYWMMRAANNNEIEARSVDPVAYCKGKKAKK